MSRADTALPNWPALLDLRSAASYLSVSESTFRLLAAKAGIEKVWPYGARLARWRRADLDRMVDSLPHSAPISGPNDAPQAAAAPAPLPTSQEEALRRIRSRAKKANRG